MNDRNLAEIREPGGFLQAIDFEIPLSGVKTEGLDRIDQETDRG
jgi:hypothetical protein